MSEQLKPRSESASLPNIRKITDDEVREILKGINEAWTNIGFTPELFEQCVADAMNPTTLFRKGMARGLSAMCIVMGFALQQRLPSN